MAKPKVRPRKKRTYVLRPNRAVEFTWWLHTTLGTKTLVNQVVGKHRVRPGDTIINYGVGQKPIFDSRKVNWINPPDAVRASANKLRTFQLLRELNLPEWTCSKDEVKEWTDDGSVVYARTKLTGHSGEGIVIVDNSNESIPEAPLYTRRFIGGREYRVHVAFGDVIGIAQKRKLTKEKLEERDIKFNRLVRNSSNGWTFSADNVVIPDNWNELGGQCIEAVSKLGLDFGAVDVVYSVRRKDFAILEVNSAPRISNTFTRDIYLRAFKERLAA